MSSQSLFVTRMSATATTTTSKSTTSNNKLMSGGRSNNNTTRTKTWSSSPSSSRRRNNNKFMITRAEIIETSPGMQELCKCEIPPHIGRADFVKQMYRWADMTYTDGGLATFGKRMSIEAINENQAGETNGYLINVYDFKDGEEQVVAELVCCMDNTMVETFDTVMPPTKPGDVAGIQKYNRNGKKAYVEGEFFLISRKLPTDESVGSVLKVVIKRMMSAINAYYAFGSPFSEEF